MTLRPAVVCLTLALALALALAACGTESKETENAAEETAEKATPAEARAEIGAVRTALDDAMVALRKGDATAADNAVSEGYLQHFERVEGPLGDVDRELNEKLEDTIREDLRDTIRQGGSVAEVTRLVGEIKADLATAEQKLR
jgi:DNA anti-recombination protein RmuC